MILIPLLLLLSGRMRLYCFSLSAHVTISNFPFSISLPPRCLHPTVLWYFLLKLYRYHCKSNDSHNVQLSLETSKGTTRDCPWTITIPEGASFKQKTTYSRSIIPSFNTKAIYCSITHTLGCVTTRLLRLSIVVAHWAHVTCAACVPLILIFSPPSSIFSHSCLWAWEKMKYRTRCSGTQNVPTVPTCHHFWQTLFT